MVNLLVDDLPSSDEEDDDYRPDLDKTAEAEDRKEYVKPGKGGRAPKRQRPVRGVGQHSAEAADEQDEDADEDADAGDGGGQPIEGENGGQHGLETLTADDQTDVRVRAKRAKTEHLWQLLNSGPGGQTFPSITQKPNVGQQHAPSLGSKNIAALCRTVDPKQAKASADAIWMRTLGIAPKAPTSLTPQSGLSPLPNAHYFLPPPPLPSSASSQRPAGQSLDKVSAAAAALGLRLTKSTTGPSQNPSLPNNPSADLSAAPGQNQSPSQPALSASVGIEHGGASAPEGKTTEDAARAALERKAAMSEASRAAAAAAMAAARESATLGSARSYNKVTVTETRRFAGKDIQVALQVDKDSKEAQRAASLASGSRLEAAPPPAAAAASGTAGQKSGLDAFLAEVDKKKKVNVLDKSKADWQQFKAQDMSLEEELEAHKRSDKQYLDKVDFLKRAELREYEKERDLRLQSDVRNRGRV